MLFDTAPRQSSSWLGDAWIHMRPTFRYLMQTEAHVYAFSMAANVLLSFFPFLIVITSICRYVLGWREAEEAIYQVLADYFPGQLGGFIVRNLRVVVASRGPLQVVSVLLLLFTANGIFEPLEVAQNRAWGILRNRSYLRNQLVSLGLILVCGSLALLSTVLAALNRTLWNALSWGHSTLAWLTSELLFRLAAVPLSVLILFLIYWLLPNGTIPARRVLVPAVAVGALLEAMRFVNLLAWPWLRVKMEREYGPFAYSATIVFIGFLASLVVLAGAQYAARGGPEEAAGENCNQARDSIDSR